MKKSNLVGSGDMSTPTAASYAAIALDFAKKAHDEFKKGNIGDEADLVVKSVDAKAFLSCISDELIAKHVFANNNRLTATPTSTYDVHEEVLAEMGY